VHVVACRWSHIQLPVRVKTSSACGPCQLPLQRVSGRCCSAWHRAKYGRHMPHSQVAELCMHADCKLPSAPPRPPSSTPSHCSASDSRPLCSKECAYTHEVPMLQPQLCLLSKQSARCHRLWRDVETSIVLVIVITGMQTLFSQVPCISGGSSKGTSCEPQANK
jgi:hypothetical protein